MCARLETFATGKSDVWTNISNASYNVFRKLEAATSGSHASFGWSGKPFIAKFMRLERRRQLPHVPSRKSETLFSKNGGQPLTQAAAALDAVRCIPKSTHSIRMCWRSETFRSAVHRGPIPGFNVGRRHFSHSTPRTVLGSLASYSSGEEHHWLSSFSERNSGSGWC